MQPHALMQLVPACVGAKALSVMIVWAMLRCVRQLLRIGPGLCVLRGHAQQADIVMVETFAVRAICAVSGVARMAAPPARRRACILSHHSGDP